MIELSEVCYVRYPFPLDSALFLFLRLVDTFLKYVFNQITLGGLESTLIIKMAVHIYVLIYCVL